MVESVGHQFQGDTSTRGCSRWIGLRRT